MALVLNSTGAITASSEDIDFEGSMLSNIQNESITLLDYRVGQSKHHRR